jgi:hypothetical protein
VEKCPVKQPFVKLRRRKEEWKEGYHYMEHRETNCED